MVHLSTFFAAFVEEVQKDAFVEIQLDVQVKTLRVSGVCDCLELEYVV